MEEGERTSADLENVMKNTIAWGRRGGRRAGVRGIEKERKRVRGKRKDRVWVGVLNNYTEAQITKKKIY